MKANIERDAIPDGWQRVRLGDVADVAFSGVDKGTVEGELPVQLCNYTDVFYNRHISAGMDLMNATATTSESDKWTLRKGDVLFTKDSETPEEIGIPAYVVDDMPGVLCGYHLGLARPQKAIVDGAFLAESLTSSESRKEFARIANGVTRFGLTLDATKTLPILLPPLPEQRAIAAVLDSIDDAIEGAEAVIDATERLRDALLHDLLTRGLPGQHTEWRDVPGLGTIPADWEVVRLGDVGEWYSGGTPSKSRPDYWSGSLPWVSPKDMKVRELRTLADYISEEGARAGSRTVPPETVLVVVRGMILAKSFPLAITRVQCAFNQDMRALICGDGFDAEYVLSALEWRRPVLLNLPTPSTHGTMRVVSEDLYNVNIPVPSLQEQIAIRQIIAEAAAYEQQSRDALQKLRTLKESSADALLTGRVRVEGRNW